MRISLTFKQLATIGLCTSIVVTAIGWALTSSPAEKEADFLKKTSYAIYRSYSPTAFHSVGFITLSNASALAFGDLDEKHIEDGKIINTFGWPVQFSPASKKKMRIETTNVPAQSCARLVEEMFDHVSFVGINTPTRNLKTSETLDPHVINGNCATRTHHTLYFVPLAPSSRSHALSHFATK